MANPVLASTSNASRNNTGSGTINVSNPASLTAGDEMCLFVTLYETGSGQTIATPSGWTSRHNVALNFVSRACFTKTATSGDVSAGSVTVSSTGGGDFMSASFHRITGSVAPSIAFSSEDDAGSAPYTTALTPTTLESLVLVFFSGADNSLGAVPTASGYSLTPTTSLTEVSDLGLRDASGDGIAHAVAQGAYDGTTEITARSVTFSEAVTRSPGSIIVIYSAPENATGTNALLSVSPTHLAQAGVAGTTGTNTLHAVSPTMFAQSGNGQRGTPWTNPNKPATNWNNLAK